MACVGNDIQLFRLRGAFISVFTKNQRMVSSGGLYVWDFEHEAKQVNVRVDGQVLFNTSLHVVDAALAGHGIAWLPEEEFSPYISEGKLTRILVQVNGENNGGLPMAKNVNFDRKKQRALDIMAAKGMWRSNYAPPLHRLLWKLGVNIPPPPFTFFWHNVLLFGPSFGLTWGIFMWFTTWQPQCVNLTTALLSSAMAGVFFGVMMAAFHRWRKYVNRLPEWGKL